MLATRSTSVGTDHLGIGLPILQAACERFEDDEFNLRSDAVMKAFIDFATFEHEDKVHSTPFAVVEVDEISYLTLESASTQYEVDSSNEQRGFELSFTDELDDHLDDDIEPFPAFPDNDNASKKENLPSDFALSTSVFCKDFPVIDLCTVDSMSPRFEYNLFCADLEQPYDAGIMIDETEEAAIEADAYYKRPWDTFLCCR